MITTTIWLECVLKLLCYYSLWLAKSFHINFTLLRISQRLHWLPFENSVEMKMLFHLLTIFSLWNKRNMQFSTVLCRIMFGVCAFVSSSGLQTVIFLIEPLWLCFTVAWTEITLRNNNICGQNMRAHFIVYHFSTVFKIQITWGYCVYSAQTWNYCHNECLCINRNHELEWRLFGFSWLEDLQNTIRCDDILLGWK